MRQAMLWLLVGIPCALWLIKNLILAMFPRLRYDGKYPVSGSIVVISLPPTCMQCNTEEMRKAWLGCRVEGELLAWGIFQASYQSCFDALIRRHGQAAAQPYIDFWIRFVERCEQLHPGPVVSTDGIRLAHHYSLTFQDCFSFSRNKCLDGQPLLASDYTPTV